MHINDKEILFLFYLIDTKTTLNDQRAVRSLLILDVMHNFS